VKIAVLNIATGPYIGLFEKSKECIKNNFLTSHEVDIFLFTDSEEKYTDDDINIKQYHVKRRGYPGDTLFRYHYFLKAEDELVKYDYIYYIDVDMNVVSEVGEEVFSELIATYHPGFYKRSGATFETRQSSTAYVSPKSGTPYYCGGFQGGTPKSYLKASREIKNNINVDGKNKIVALWHDESHWNAYLNKNAPTLSLDPRYCYPEEGYDWLREFSDTKKIVATIKNEAALRSK